MSEVRRVLLANGQYIEIVQETGTSTGSVMSQNAVTTALNGKANSSHSHTASNITEGTFSTAMIADGAITSGKLAANAVVNAKIADGAVTSGKLASNSVTTAKVADGAITKAKLASEIITSMSSFEIVSITGTCANGYSVRGKQISIGGSIYEFDDTGVIKAAIPYGQEYTIRPIITKGYYSSDRFTYTASTATRLVSVTYNFMALGVYIQNTSGELYSVEDWSNASNKTHNGVAVIDADNSFVIAAKSNDYRMVLYDSVTSYMSSYLTKHSIFEEALFDFNGYYNTLDIADIWNSEAYAAKFCLSYQFPDGVTRGYLPSYGEMGQICNSISAINQALLACGATQIYEYNDYWTSTYYGTNSAGQDLFRYVPTQSGLTEYTTAAAVNEKLICIIGRL